MYGNLTGTQIPPSRPCPLVSENAVFTNAVWKIDTPSNRGGGERGGFRRPPQFCRKNKHLLREESLQHSLPPPLQVTSQPPSPAWNNVPPSLSNGSSKAMARTVTPLWYQTKVETTEITRKFEENDFSCDHCSFQSYSLSFLIQDGGQGLT